MSGGGEDTCVALYVVDFKSRGAFIRCYDLLVELTLVPKVAGLYGECEVIVVDVRDGGKYWRSSTRLFVEVGTPFA